MGAGTTVSLPRKTRGPGSVTRIPARALRLPRVARSAAFGVLFVSALVLLVVGALLSFSDDPEQVRRAFNVLRANLVLIGVIAVYLAFRVYLGLFAPSHGGSAPLLHRRFVIIFSLAALLPAIIIGAFSASLISQNVSALFGSDVRDNMDSAQTVLNEYYSEQLIELASDTDIVRGMLAGRETGFNDRISLTAELQIRARVRDVDAIVVLREDGQVLAEAIGPRAPVFEVPRPDLLAAVPPGQAEFLQNDETNYLIALRRLEADSDVLLYVGRRLRSSSAVLSNIRGIEDAVERIDRFTDNQVRLNAIFALTFVETALLLLITAIWLGLVLANRIIAPLASLIDAAEAVRGGDMGARVSVSGEWGEISDLGSAFNRMTQQLTNQRDELVREHDVSEQRRKFSEAVLSGVRAGVIGLTTNGRITLMNASAERLLGLSSESALDRPLSEIMPDFAPAFLRARESVTNTAEDQITYERDEAGTMNIDLRVASYQGARADTGWVVTFDDMTRLVAAQRQGAWREVARRIAHEIKNPLTPIQLSAERLSRKYGRVLTEDRDVFDSCTQTIIRQVGSLERMVDEFSAFARMPEPEMELLELTDVLDAVLFEQGVAFPDIRFLRSGAWPAVDVLGDERLVNQALTNIYKNAAEAVLRAAEADAAAFHGEIRTVVRPRRDVVEIVITDNGPGFPAADIERLLEPYVTTRDGGTGLGLPIVKRIVEDHGGALRLCARDDGRRGAQVVVTLPVHSNAMNDTPHQEAAE